MCVSSSGSAIPCLKCVFVHTPSWFICVCVHTPSCLFFVCVSSTEAVETTFRPCTHTPPPPLHCFFSLPFGDAIKDVS